MLPRPHRSILGKCRKRAEEEDDQVSLCDAATAMKTSAVRKRREQTNSGNKQGNFEHLGGEKQPVTITTHLIKLGLMTTNTCWHLIG